MNYIKVVVFTPLQTLEKIEPDDSKISHEDILYNMFDEKIWKYYDESVSLREYISSSSSGLPGIKSEHLKELTTCFGLPVNLRAAYLAFQVGFSVVYESENNILIFASKEVTDEMIEYVKTDYENETNRYLSIFCADDEDVLHLETNKENIPHNVQYKMVYSSLLNALKKNNKNWKEEQGAPKR